MNKKIFLLALFITCSNLIAQVYKYDKSWNVTTSEKQPIRMLDIAYANKTIYVLGKTGAEKAIIKEYKLDGTEIKEIVFSDSAKPKLVNPSAFDVDAGGRFYIIDMNKVVRIYNPEGKHIYNIFDAKRFYDVVSFSNNPNDSITYISILFEHNTGDQENMCGLLSRRITFFKDKVKQMSDRGLLPFTFIDDKPFLVTINKQNHPTSYSYAIGTKMHQVNDTYMKDYKDDIKHCEQKNPVNLSGIVLLGNSYYSSFYAVDSSNHKFFSYSSGGSCVSEYGEYGSAPGKFIKPISISADENENLYIVDAGNNRIQKFKKGGVVK